MDVFWNKTPLIGMSPMDGVTDAPFRLITDELGHPDLMMTEFIPVEAIIRGSTRVLTAFAHHNTHTPTLAQIYGTNLDAYRQAAIIACELDFDGIDINMGCPDRAVARKGAGAGLIKTPKLAQHIIKTVKHAVHDWAEGKTMQQEGIREEMIDKVEEYKKRFELQPQRQVLPVSVKTRIGYDEITTEEWIGQVLEAQPAAISLHGRTLAQMYTGLANWDEIGKAAEHARAAGIPLLGNGDIKSKHDARLKIKEYNLAGVLIGRASFGNPWVFSEENPTPTVRLKTAMRHAQLFESMIPEGHFLSMRKHLAWYTKGFDDAAEVRKNLMEVQNADDVARILTDVIEGLDAHSHDQYQ